MDTDWNELIEDDGAPQKIDDTDVSVPVRPVITIRLNSEFYSRMMLSVENQPTDIPQ